MAIRYSGDVRVRILYSDARSAYLANVSWPGGRTLIVVGEPSVLTHAVDSSVAYDAAARAAVVFAEDEQVRKDGHSIPCAWDGSGPYVSRRESVRAGGKPCARRG